MKQSLKVELQNYSKDELIWYLTQIAMYLPEYSPPGMVILGKRLDDTYKKIEINIKNRLALHETHAASEMDTVDYLLRSAKLQKAWKRLQKQRDQLMEQLYPDDEQEEDAP